MDTISFQSFEELSEAFSNLKRKHKLHSLVEDRLASLLQDIYPDGYPKTEPGEMPGSRADLAFYLGDRRYVVFEVFATVSQVAQDLRHLEQSNAQARIAILTDPTLDNGAIFDEYFRKKPRDPFHWVKLSEILVAENEVATKEKLKQYIDEEFASSKISPETTVDIISHLQKFGLADETEENFGKSEFTTNLALSIPQFVILVAIPLNNIVASPINVLKATKNMLKQENWYTAPTGTGHPPKYWPYSIFELPHSLRSGKDTFYGEYFSGPEKSVVTRLVVTDTAEVFFASSILFVREWKEKISIFELGRILAECWKLSGLVAQLYHEVGYSGETHLCIGMVNTLNSYLGGFVDKRREPDSPSNRHHMLFPELDWSCHSPHLKFCEIVNLSKMKPKEQPEFIKQFGERISLAYNQDIPLCFEKETGLIPQRYFRRSNL